MAKRSNSEICHDIADNLMNRFIFKTIPGKKDEEIWVYDDGIYKDMGKSLIKAKTEQALGPICKTNMVNEVINKIARRTYIQRESFRCNDLDLVCVNNGILNIRTKKLIPHSPTMNFMNKLPIDYIPEAYCSSAFEFLSGVLHDKDIDCIQEWAGYHLVREYFIKKAAIFRGGTDTGKTTFMNLLSSFIGKPNCSNISLQALAHGKWHVLSLYNKYANIHDDLSEKDVADTGIFKQVTGRSPIQAEQKFGDQFSFENYAKLSFACNNIPDVNSDVDDEAHWNRWMIFDFDNVFNKKSNVDVHMIDKITTKEELSGLLNWAIEGLERLRKKGHFSYKRNWEVNRSIMQGEASSVARFCNECLLNVTGEWVSNEEMYQKYEEFCDLNSITDVELLRKFGMDIRKYCNYGKFHANKGNVWGVRNVKIKEILPILGM